MLALFLALEFVLRKTRFGRNTYAVGANMKSSYLAGIATKRIQVYGYVISAVCAAYAGVLMTAQVGAIVPASGTGQEMEVIAAIVLGGLSLNGGEGKLVGTLLGTLIITVISNGLTLLSVQSYYQMLAKGLILIIAVYVDSVRKSVKVRAL
jgi:ribose transport system permease protein